ncbi:MAG: 1-acyl-sn-glycerol-3-phosphate acyltransferase [Erysipelotrichaceae bacterium]|nr:1-acyl-sn-glycerol-3-phosphate acyltransferase [Erysipelotrichaceae bacterium]
MKKSEVQKERKGLYPVFKVMLYPVAASFRPQLKGQENIPEEGPVIIACNHIGNTDPGYACMATKRMIHFMAKKELFDSPFSWFFKSAGTIRVDRENHGGNALEKAEQILNEGGVIGIYPEGTRNRTNQPLQPFKHGAVRLARRTGATIVPMAIRGNFRKGMKVAFGKGFTVSKEDEVSEATEKLYQKVLELYLDLESDN